MRKEMKINLREFTEEDITEDYLEMLNGVNKYSQHNGIRFSRAKAKEFIKENKKARNIMILITNETNEFLGTSRCIRVRSGEYNAGIMLSGNIRGKGYGKIIWQAILEFLLIKYGSKKIYAGTQSGNSAMVKILESTMTFTGKESKAGLTTFQYVYE